MGLSKTIWTNPTEFLTTEKPENPVLFFAPSVLQAMARKFIDSFPGMVTYAVKSNPMEEVIEDLSAAGLRGFDVASPFEMRLIKRLAPDAALQPVPLSLSRPEQWAVFRMTGLAEECFQLASCLSAFSSSQDLLGEGTISEANVLLDREVMPTMTEDMVAQQAALASARDELATSKVYVDNVFRSMADSPRRIQSFPPLRR